MVLDDSSALVDGPSLTLEVVPSMDVWESYRFCSTVGQTLGGGTSTLSHFTRKYCDRSTSPAIILTAITFTVYRPSARPENVRLADWFGCRVIVST